MNNISIESKGRAAWAFQSSFMGVDGKTALKGSAMHIRIAQQHAIRAGVTSAVHQERLDKVVKREALNAALASCKAGIGENIPGGEMQARLARAAMHQVANMAYAKATGASMLAATASTVASAAASALEDARGAPKPGEIRKYDYADFAPVLAASGTLVAGGDEHDIATASHLATYTITYNDKPHRVDPLAREQEEKAKEKALFDKVVSEEIAKDQNSGKHFTPEEMDAIKIGVVLPSVHEKFAVANTESLPPEHAQAIIAMFSMVVPAAPAARFVGTLGTKLAPAAAEGIAAVETKVAARLGLVGKGPLPQTTLRGTANPKVREATERGRAAHRAFKAKVDAKKSQGWIGEPTNLVDPVTKRRLIPDAITPSGRPIELKPNTPSGILQGARQLKKYQDATGLKGRVVYYDK